MSSLSKDLPAGLSTGLTYAEGRSGWVTAREVVRTGVDAGKEARHAAAFDAEGRLL